MNRLSCFLCFAALAAGLGGSAGCSRQHYRAKADREVYSILKQGNNDSRWNINDYGIVPDADSRMFDPSHPDCEPMPTDDPTAHQKMHNVAGMKGSSHWHDNGDTSTTENPHWRYALLLNDKGEVPLDKEKAVELSLRHSPEYQSALENLYFSAMAVSRQRYGYDIQFFGGDSMSYSTSSGTTIDSPYLGARKYLATGGNWVVNVANSITWSFNNGSWDVGGSLFSAGITQPLLRGAGRKYALEDLTQAERKFLYDLRQMVLFQQGYYTRIVTGQAGRHTSAPSGSSGATTPGSTGFYALLEGQIQIQNQRQNMIGLQENLNRFQEMFEAGQVDNLYQVEQTRQSLLMSQSDLLGQINTYQSNVETYVRSLGLPPDLAISISDPLLEQFQLTSPTLTSLMNDVGELLMMIRKTDQPLADDFRNEVKEIIRRTEGEIAIFNQDLEALQKSVPIRLRSLKSLESQLAERIASGERIDPSVYDTAFFEKRIAKLRSEQVPQNHERLQAAFLLLHIIADSEESELRDMIRNRSFTPEVLKALEEDLKLTETAEASPEAAAAQRQQELDKTTEELRALQEALGLDPKREPTRRIIAELRQKDEYRDWIRRVVSAFQSELVLLSLNQTRTRVDAMTLVPVEITAEEAFQTAAEHRLDWMNQKSQLVDRWRQIELEANQLKGALSLTFDGSAGKVNKTGVHFNGDNSNMSVGLAWTTPLNRYNEMMAYRSSQIAYQNARRNYYTYVDGVQAELRNTVRDVQRLQIDFEIRRNQVLVDTVRVDVMQLQMERPPQRGGRIDTNTSQQLVDAFNGLLRSQNSFLSTWVRYQTQRMLLDQNMGTMTLDERGHWIEPGVIGSDVDITPPGLAPQIPIPILATPRLNRRYVE